MNPTTRVAIAAILTALVAGPMVEQGAAKKQRARMTARIDGQRFKGLKVATIILYASTTFSVNSQTKVKRGVSRALTINCGPQIDLRALPIPSPTLLCFGIYQINSTRGGDQKTWIGATQTMELVVTGFDGTRADRTFRGTIPSIASNPVEPPVTIEEGRFTAFLQNVGV